VLKWRIATIQVIMVGACAIAPALAGVTSFTNEAAWQSEISSRTVATFDGFSGIVSSQYPGAVFVGINASCQTYNYDPQATAVSSPNIMAIRQPGSGAWGGSWRIDFSQPVAGAALWYMDVENPGSSVILKDGSGSVLGDYEFVAHGGWHTGGLSFVGLVSDATNISHLELSYYDPEWIGFDNVQWGVPEPASLLLLAFGGSAVILRRRR
jgi:hypothetical protein